jgi:hypothetical protein
MARFFNFQFEVHLRRLVLYIRPFSPRSSPRQWTSYFTNIYLNKYTNACKRKFNVNLMEFC